MLIDLDLGIEQALTRLLSIQHPDGYWVGELGCDASVTAEALYLRHLLGRVDLERDRRAVAFLLAEQNLEGGWSHYEGGPSEVNATLKIYLALKLMGEDANSEAMRRAREVAVSLGGVEACHLFTRIFLAWGGLYPWSRLPSIPPEILALPDWIFSRYDLSYWARTILVPLLITLAYRPVYPLDLRLDELASPGRAQDPPAVPGPMGRLIDLAERALNWYGRHPHPGWRQHTLRDLEQWMVERFERSNGLGAIWPAMVNAVVALDCLGHPRDSRAMQEALAQLDRLDLEDGRGRRTQPCLSPVWDTAWVVEALLSTGLPSDHPALGRAGRWLLTKQAVRSGDWRSGTVGEVEPGGWYFQFANEFYPDVDDTAVVLMALRRLPMTDDARIRRQLEKGLAWIAGMQNADGGWGAFDRTRRDRSWLNWFSWARPFDGALCDPSTPDVSARCLEALGKYCQGQGSVARQAIDYLRKTQEPDGSWFGRWGVNYVYGTWSALCALEAAGLEASDPMIQRAIAYLKRAQLPDGGWGETCHTYAEPSARGRGPSSPSQTAWGLMALIAAGEHASEAAFRAACYLLERLRDGAWSETAYTGTGFPRGFYLRYGMYAQYFPLLALGRYRARLVAGRALREVVP